MSAVSFRMNISQTGPSKYYKGLMDMVGVEFNPSVNEEKTEIAGYHYTAEKQDSYTNGTPLKISAILRLKEDKNFGCLSRGLYYTKAFADQYISDAVESDLYNDMKNHITNEAISGVATEYKAYVKLNFAKEKELGFSLTRASHNSCSISSLEIQGHFLTYLYAVAPTKSFRFS